MMLGEQAATVVSVSPFSIHGMPMVDLVIRYTNAGQDASARIGAESIPEGLAAGEAVMVMHAANMVVSVRRA